MMGTRKPTFEWLTDELVDELASLSGELEEIRERYFGDKDICLTIDSSHLTGNTMTTLRFINGTKVNLEQESITIFESGKNLYLKN